MLNRVELVWALLLLLVTPAYAADAPGVTKTGIKIGATATFQDQIAIVEGDRLDLDQHLFRVLDVVPK